MFSGAYCIQARIARELAEQGRWDEAEVHYRRAFELMPDSFGRMESHCFGCEGTFTGARVQRLAEAVFLKRLEQNADHPRVHYLLGYLRSAQGDDAAAIEHYRRATELDPDYINAWKRYAESAGRLGLPIAEITPIQVAMLRLDPAQNHLHVGQVYAGFVDMWQVLSSAEAVAFPPQPTDLVPLARRSQDGDDWGYHFSMHRHGQHNEIKTPTEFLVQANPVIQQLRGIYQQLNVHY